MSTVHIYKYTGDLQHREQRTLANTVLGVPDKEQLSDYEDSVLYIFPEYSLAFHTYPKRIRDEGVRDAHNIAEFVPNRETVLSFAEAADELHYMNVILPSGETSRVETLDISDKLSPDEIFLTISSIEVCYSVGDMLVITDGTDITETTLEEFASHLSE